ncbi:hypothetical protein QBC44DRAFT_154759 [Cladorrhinum sp. PSN332]|nr:hypothetical protein QBC44DRAFT_154759 [Cladorrhinum sp. PSN332]
MAVNVNEITQFLTTFNTSPAYSAHGRTEDYRTARSFQPASSYSSVTEDFDDTQSESTMRSSNASTVFTYKSRHSAASTAPSRRSNAQTFTQFANQAPAQPPAPNQFLWCEFSVLLDCQTLFRLDDEANWIQHHLDHLQNNCPNQSMCWFCDDLRIRADRSDDAYVKFWQRMEHIRGHIMQDPELTVDVMRPDFNLVNHIHRTGLLPDPMYQHAITYDELPEAFQLPESSSSSQPLDRYPRDQNQYVVEPVRSERRRDRPRDRERQRHGRRH